MITPAQPADAPALSDLINSAFRGDSSRKGWTTEADLLDGIRIDAEALTASIASPGTVLLKYVEEGSIFGCVELRREADMIYLGMLTVQPGLQAKGIGKKLLLAAEQEALRQGCKGIFMTVISVRIELIDWYLRHGYRDTGVRKPFKTSDPRWGVTAKKLEFAVLEKILV